MARSAADRALELPVPAGPDELGDGIGYKIALPPPRHNKLVAFRVPVIDAHRLCPTAAGVRAALNSLGERLARHGCSVTRSLGDMPNLAMTTRNYVESLSAYLTADVSPDECLHAEAGAASLSPDNLSIDAAWLRGETTILAAWQRTGRIRRRRRARWQALFREVDVILCPPMPTPALPHDHSPHDARLLDFNGRKVPYDHQVAWPAAATLVGLPATVAPIGHTGKGLSIGVQIIGGYLADHTTIAFAALIERAFGGFTRPPGF